MTEETSNDAGRIAVPARVQGDASYQKTAACLAISLKAVEMAIDAANKALHETAASPPTDSLESWRSANVLLGLAFGELRYDAGNAIRLIRRLPPPR